MRDYRKYAVWGNSHELVLFIYNHVAPRLPRGEQYNLTSQMKRAAYSIPFNIVEGSGRHSQKDFAHFINISLGSALELEYCCILIKDLQYISENLYELLNKKVNEIKAMLIGLIKVIRAQSL